MMWVRLDEGQFRGEEVAGTAQEKGIPLLVGGERRRLGSGETVPLSLVVACAPSFVESDSQPDDWCNDPSRGWSMDGPVDHYVYVSTLPHVVPPPRLNSAGSIPARLASNVEPAE